MRLPTRWSPARPPRCSCGRTAGRLPSQPRCGARADSSSPVAASPSRPSSHRLRRAKRPPRRGRNTMPGLLRGVARTAVIAGTATSVSNRVSRRQANRWSQQDAAQEPAYQEPAYQEPPPPAAPDPIEQLKQLGALHEQGILTDEEFAEQKAKILG